MLYFGCSPFSYRSGEGYCCAGVDGKGVEDALVGCPCFGACEGEGGGAVPVVLGVGDNDLVICGEGLGDHQEGVVVSYTQDGKEGTASLALAGTVAWTANKSILYTLIINPGTAVKFTATVGKWDDGLDIELTDPAPTTIDELTAAVAEGKYYEKVDLTDVNPSVEPNTGTWAELRTAVDAYEGNGTLDLTMSGLTTANIPGDAFYNYYGGKITCTALKSFSAPNFTGSIEGVHGGGAFAYCTALESVNLPKMAGDIGVSAFFNCIALESVNLPKMAGSIESYAFDNCNVLTSITLGPIADGSTISGSAFYRFTTDKCDLIFTGTPKGQIKDGKTWTVGSNTWTFKSVKEVE